MMSSIEGSSPWWIPSQTVVEFQQKSQTGKGQRGETLLRRAGELSSSRNFKPRRQVSVRSFCAYGRLSCVVHNKLYIKTLCSLLAEKQQEGLTLWKNFWYARTDRNTAARMQVTTTVYNLRAARSRQSGNSMSKATSHELTYDPQSNGSGSRRPRGNRSISPAL